LSHSLSVSLLPWHFPWIFPIQVFTKLQASTIPTRTETLVFNPSPQFTAQVSLEILPRDSQSPPYLDPWISRPSSTLLSILFPSGGEEGEETNTKAALISAPPTVWISISSLCKQPLVTTKLPLRSLWRTP
jgi:hypothetical protein